MLAPLESVSDSAWRRLCWSQGASFVWTEMVRAAGLARKNRATLELVDTWDEDVPTGIQLLAVNERELAKALGRLEALAESTHPHFNNIRAVDLNFGCPSPDVIRLGAGPALLKRRAKLAALFSTLRSWQRQTNLPVSFIGAKVRLGMNQREQDQKVYMPIVEPASKYLDYLTVHARHARQGSNDTPSWAPVSEMVREASKMDHEASVQKDAGNGAGESKIFPTPVSIFANGDIGSLDQWYKVKTATGASGALVARAAIRSPWVFRELTNQGPSLPSLDELDAAQAEYFKLAQARGTREKYIAWHTEGFRRLRLRVEGKPLGQKGSVLPKNEHMK